MSTSRVPDKSWLILPSSTKEFRTGLSAFTEYAVAKCQGLYSEGYLPCPCKHCCNKKVLSISELRRHVIYNGWLTHYDVWTYHGERYSDSTDHVAVSDNIIHNDLRQLICVAMGSHNQTGNDVNELNVIENPIDHSEDPEDPIDPSEDSEDPTFDEYDETFVNRLKDSEQPLWPGCTEFTKLSFILELYQCKCLNQWSNKSFETLLSILRRSHPNGNETIPKTMYEAKTVVRDLGLRYDKIHACPNDCILYRKEYEKMDSCPICGTSRWVTHDVKKQKHVPAKYLRHFPLIPRLKRLFLCQKVSEEMSWHEDRRVKDGILRHPADSLQWTHFDELHPEFASEPRNIRLGLASDGFNPFSTMSVSHSTWPVVVIPYNLPPWMCMKQPNFILSLLISGPTSPGKDIDVFLQPLIEELEVLWTDGVSTFDVRTNKNFQMRAALLWTIHDYPGYGDLSGWSTKGKFACAVCHKDTNSIRLKFGKKECFMGHRRFLELEHPFRREKKKFDNTIETRSAPNHLTGVEVFEMLKEYHEYVVFGKKSLSGQNVRKKLKNTPLPVGWKKFSIFFKLPYWKTLLLRHNIDVMHTEKNVCDNILNTLLDIDGKSKDNLMARFDLQAMGIRKELHPIQKNDSEWEIPKACFNLSNEEKTLFCKVFSDLKVPDGYVSDISRNVKLKEKKFTGLKSHDCHMIMQQLLPIALRRSTDPKVTKVLIEISNYFNDICSKTIDVKHMEKLEKEIVVTLCKLEQLFPPSFFTVMIHLVVHLASEVRIAGPVQYRWMYPIERYKIKYLILIIYLTILIRYLSIIRYLLTLKKYVRNRSHPEGSIAEAYLAEESLTFCSRFLHNVETKSNRVDRYIDGYIGSPTRTSLSTIEFAQVHRCILFSQDIIEKYRDRHIEDIKHRYVIIRIKLSLLIYR